MWPLMAKLATEAKDNPDTWKKLWSKVKAFLRKFKARTLDTLPDAIQHASQNVSSSNCSGWFRSCGYAL